MTWRDQLNSGARWAAGPAFFHSRAGARWLVALAATTFIFFFVAWRYNGDAYANLLAAGGKSATGSTYSAARLPAWIDTPPVFDISLLPGGSASYKGPEATTPAPSAAKMESVLPAHLADALGRFLSRPALSHEQARRQNEADCPPAQLEKQVNADQLRDGREKWLAVDAVKVVDMRADAVRFMVERAEEEGSAAMVGPGLLGASGGDSEGKAVKKGSRGVVIAAGNRRTVERAVVCVREMQKLGWKGPVEVWHFEGELEDEKDREKLRELGVGIHMVSLFWLCL